MQKNYPNTDIILFIQDKRSCLLSISFIRNSMHYGIKYYEIEAKDLLQFIIQFYNKFNIPKHILINFDLDDISLSLIKKEINQKIILKDIRKLKQMSYLYDFIKSNTENKLREFTISYQKWEDDFKSLENLLAIKQDINIIESYDNSHFSGSNPIGGFITANRNGFLKSSYRHFPLHTQEMDDHKILSYTILKRFTTKTIKYRPDLILIDGDIKQLKTVKKALTTLAIDNIILLAIAKTGGRRKGTETLFTENRIIYLDKDSHTLHFLQKLRDEAHHNVISWNRKAILKNITKSSLELIPSIGKHRKQLLLRHFGSYENIKQATTYDLLNVKGINKKTAEIIYKFIHSEN